MAENLMLVKNKIGNRLHFEIITVMCASRFFKFVFPNYNSKLLTKYPVIFSVRQIILNSPLKDNLGECLSKETEGRRGCC